MSEQKFALKKPVSRWFQQQLLGWYDVHGRKDLPWQNNPTPYRVWVSEIMLQQTQVATVIPYYQRFMSRFPDLATLANTSVDEVLHLWSGLGYYARGRNLHRAAQQIIEEYNGLFPDNIDNLINLPGIGRSTAGAILALAANQHQAILDGNVKRVLARFAAIDGWPGRPAVQDQLWQLATELTPKRRVSAYTQAIMDLGATLCTRRQPACDQCPLRSNCQAHALRRTHELPSPKPRKTLPVRQTHMLILVNDQGHILLQKRPPSGIWGGLWSLPEYTDSHNGSIHHWAQQQLGYTISTTETGQPLRHTFSHFHLDITPVLARINHTHRVMDASHCLWYNSDHPESLGMAAPIKKLLARVNSSTNINEGIST
jgi:A/G-specific adenine glycosylase